MAKSNKFRLITYLPCPLCICAKVFWHLFGKFVSIPHDTLKNYVLKPYFQYLLAFQCKFHRRLLLTFCLLKAVGAVVNRAKCDGMNSSIQSVIIRLNYLNGLYAPFLLLIIAQRSLSKS